jgi:hypothetical protein
MGNGKGKGGREKHRKKRIGREKETNGRME